MLDLDRLRAAPLEHDPFEFVVVDNFVRPEAVPGIIDDFPAVRGAGSFPVESLDYGPVFGRLFAALTGPELTRAIADKFAVDLAGRPTMLTVRGIGETRDGFIHTDFGLEDHHAAALHEPGVGTCRGPAAAIARRARPRRLRARGGAACRNDAGIPAQRALVSRAPDVSWAASRVATELGARSRGCQARTRPAPLVGAAQITQPARRNRRPPLTRQSCTEADPGG